MNGKQKKYLRGLAHDHKPLVHIGQRGLSSSVVQQIESALADHELIKIKVAAESPVDRREVGEELTKQTGCEIAGQIGRVLILFKPNPDNPRIRLPEISSTTESTGE